LHIVINEKGELLNFVITPGNVDDRESSGASLQTRALNISPQMPLKLPA
jgi:hypothetical protein